MKTNLAPVPSVPAADLSRFPLGGKDGNDAVSAVTILTNVAVSRLSGTPERTDFATAIAPCRRLLQTHLLAKSPARQSGPRRQLAAAYGVPQLHDKLPATGFFDVAVASLPAKGIRIRRTRVSTAPAWYPEQLWQTAATLASVNRDNVWRWQSAFQDYLRRSFISDGKLPGPVLGTGAAIWTLIALEALSEAAIYDAGLGALMALRIKDIAVHLAAKSAPPTFADQLLLAEVAAAIARQDGIRDDDELLKRIPLLGMARYRQVWQEPPNSAPDIADIPRWLSRYLDRPAPTASS